MLTQNPVAPLILVVEDDDNHAEMIQRSFEDAQEEYRLEIAGTLLGAWKVIERQPPDLVLTDYLLPDGDGCELVVMVNDACPVILMTSIGNEQVAVRAMKIGAQDYVVKTPAVFSGMSRISQRGLREWALIQGRIQAEKDIRDAKQDWERTFDAVPDLIAIIDLNYTITRVNKAMADHCGLSPAELSGRKCHEVMHGLVNPRHSCPHARMIKDGLCQNEQIREKLLNGVFDVTVSPLYNSEGELTACVHVARDITERKQAEEEHQKLEQQFQQTQKLESLGVLAGGIAHDFNNILTIILGHCYVAREDADSGMSQTAHFRQIEIAANRAADLCRQMLAYAGKSGQIMIRVNLWLAVDEIVNMLRSAFKKNVTIDLQLNKNVPEIVCDSSQMQQIIMNLITNAAEAIGDNCGTVTVRLNKAIVEAVGSESDFNGEIIQPGQYACIEVTDTGCGMDEETRRRMFEPFFTSKFTGRGLGMSAVLGIVRSHGGAIQVSSALNAGTTIKVYFPFPAKGALTDEMPEALPSPNREVHGTVLLVDDEEALCRIESSILSAIGFTVMTASDGADALEIYRRAGSSIDMVLLDVVMRGMNGVDVYRELRKMSAAVPVIMISGCNPDSFALDIDADKHAAYIRKPYKPEMLRDVLLAFSTTER